MWRNKDIAWVPALAGAAVSVGLSRSGFLGFLFLLPLGVVAYCHNARTAWFSAAASMAGNLVFLLILGMFQPYDVRGLGADMVYLGALTAAFAWIAAPPARGPAIVRMSAAYRILAGSVLASLAFAFALRATGEGLSSMFRDQAETLASLYAAASGADEVERSLTEQYVTADRVLETLEAASLRGGVVVSCVALFFLSRQASRAIAGLIRRKRIGGPSLAFFHARPECVWALSASLLGILAGKGLGIAPLEIAAWNVLVICGILYLVQGCGIALFFLGRAPLSAGMRFALNVAIAVVVLSPGINAALLGVLILLGIAENWAPFRAPKPNGPPPTPGA